MTERKKQKFRKEEIKRMILRITNKTVSCTSCPFVSYVDMCCFQDIKQLLCLAVITNIWIIIFAWTIFSKFLHINDLHDIVSFNTPVMFRSQWLVILSQYLSFLNFPQNVTVTLIIKKQAPMTACIIQLLHFVIKNLLHTINSHGCKKHQLAVRSLANWLDWR